MKKINIIFFFLFSHCLFSRAQELDIVWSNVRDLDRGVSKPEVIGMDDENILMLQSTYFFYGGIEKARLEIYDKKSLILKNTIDFSSPDYKKVNQGFFTKIFYQDKKITFFSNNSDDNFMRILGSIINVDGTIVELGRAIIEVNKKNTKGGAVSDILTNSNRDKYLININMPTAKKENEQIRYVLLDNKLDVLGDKNITLPYIDDLFITENTLMDSKGTIHLCGTKYADKAEKRKKNGVSVIFSYSFESGDFSEIKFPVVHNLMWSISTSIDKNDNFLIQGRYQDIKENKEEDGIFSLIMETATGKLINNYTWPITEAVLPEGLDDYNANNLDNNYYKLRKIITISPEKKVAIMESVFYRSESNNGFRLDVTTSENILVLTLNISGKIESIKVVPKNQQIREDSRSNALTDFISFTPLYKDNSLYLLYNDHSKNIERNFPEKMVRTRFQTETASYLAKISPEGTVTRNILLKKKDDEGFLITPGNSFQISESEVLVFSYKLNFTDKSYKMGIITFNK